MTYLKKLYKAYTLLEVRYGGGFAAGRFPEGGGGFPGDDGFVGGDGGRHPDFFRSEAFINESLVVEIEVLEGADMVIPFFEKTEGTNQAVTTPFSTDVEMLVPDYTIEGVVLNNEIINNYNVLPNTILEGRNLEDRDTELYF